VKRTTGITNPVNVERAALDRLADEEHAKHAAAYVARLEARDRENTLRARAFRAAAIIARRLGLR
jgi:hypothetical protein